MDQAYLYLMETDGCTKIGISQDPTIRVMQLQTGNPTPIRLAYQVLCPTRQIAKMLEDHLHRRYDHTRTQGEWFEVSPDEIRADVDLVFSILGSVARHIKPVVTTAMSIRFVSSPLPETTKGEEKIDWLGRLIFNRWIMFDETRSKVYPAGSDFSVTPWLYKRMINLISSTDTGVVDAVKAASLNRLANLYGRKNAGFVSQRTMTPYTIVEHVARTGYYNDTGAFVRCA